MRDKIIDNDFSKLFNGFNLTDGEVEETKTNKVTNKRKQKGESKKWVEELDESSLLKHNMDYALKLVESDKQRRRQNQETQTLSLLSEISLNDTLIMQLKLAQFDSLSREWKLIDKRRWLLKFARAARRFH